MAGVECHGCGAHNSDGVGITGSDDPSEGAVAICAYCSTVSVYTGVGWETRAPSRDELVEIMADPLVRNAIAVLNQHLR